MSDPVNAADAIVQAEAMLGQDSYARLENYLEHITMENFLGQLVVILVAYGLGWWLSRRINAYATLLVPKESSDRSFKAQLRRGLMHIVHAVSMSFVTGCLVSLGTYILLNALRIGEEALLCRIAYNVMFAYGILLVLLTCLGALIGEKHVTPAVRRYLSYGFWLLVILQFFGVLGDIILTLDEIRLPIGSGGLSLWKLLLAFITICLTIAVANALGNCARRFIDEKSGWTPNLKIVVSRVVYVFFMILAVVFGLGAVGIDLTVLSVFGGALGVGLGFGLQKIASNYISGFIILIDRSIKIGDLVEAAGFRVQLLSGGYKAYRRHVRLGLAQPRRVVVLGGMTGSGKTEILHALSGLGAQVIDLEGLAVHRGSAFGYMGRQPCNEWFENQLFEQWRTLDPQKPVWLEDESIHIGNVTLCAEFFSHLSPAPLVRVDVPEKSRVERLVRLYADSGMEDGIRAALLRLKKRLGLELTQRCLESLDAGDYHAVARAVLSYYDRCYRYQLEHREGPVIPLPCQEDDPEKTARSLMDMTLFS